MCLQVLRPESTPDDYGKIFRTKTGPKQLICLHVSDSRIRRAIEKGTVEVPLSQPCFEHFFRPCFRGHDEAGLLAFEALRGSPRPARGQASDAKRNGTRTKPGSPRLESI